jgi:two-component system, NarL family, response regulator LiaR
MSLSSPDGPSRSRSRADQIRVLIADDHRSFAEALRVAIRAERGMSVVAVVHDGEEAVRAAFDKRPDVVLMDVAMPRSDGIAATRRIKEERPDTRVVMLSAYGEEHNVARAIDAGASGFVSKLRPMRDVARSIRAAYRGQALIEPEEMRRILMHLRRKREQDAVARGRVERLTRREIEILQGLANGIAPGRLAQELGISRNTLRTHVQNILFKLKVHSKHEAIVQAIHHGKIQTGEPM